MNRIETIAIVGGGFSGTLAALNMLRFEGPKATLIERSIAQIGRGVAYSTDEDSHILNVRAGNMSAFPDQPRHFLDWLETDPEGARSGTFVRRHVYGRYLSGLLQQALEGSDGRLSVVEGDAIDLDLQTDGVTVRLGDGSSRTFDAAILAPGNLPPHDPPGVDDLTSHPDVYRGDPWAHDNGAGLTARDDVLLLGSGLTAIDVALRLLSTGFGGRITALSRRGLRPRSHDVTQHPTGTRALPAQACTHLIRQVRQRAREVGWRSAVDELRPETQALWQRADLDTRQRFLRHLRPWWDVHRHRLAPEVGSAIEHMVASDKLRFVAGSLLTAEAVNGQARVQWRPRGGDEPQATTFRRVINCTGPQGDLLRTDEPLLQALTASGTIRADPARLGVEVDAQCRTIAHDGRPNDRVLAVGPITRGAFWEIVAVPDIRQQAWDLARRLSHAHWVGGEGL